jgi:chromosome segregation ATPase
MAVDFFQTIRGIRFVEGTVPAIERQLSNLNTNLEALHTALVAREARVSALEAQVEELKAALKTKGTKKRSTQQEEA